MEFLRDNEYATNGEAVVFRPAVQNRFGDARPANVHLPRAEILRISLIAGTQLIQVPITVCVAGYILSARQHRPSGVSLR